MINAKHLMIGNLFTDDQNEILKIDLIDSVEETVNANGMEDISTSDLIPIELTEDILLKCGFSKTNNDSYFGTNKWSNGEFILTVDDDCFVSMESTYHRKCEFLHQLQNLYFSLTQKELTVNLQ